ncbi:O-acetyl-ADP-ribose deacetylase [Planctomycetes bacterium Pan216]|uniref:O-acetyl-ADP-ribose deacetylase n=1 Tax=Kolteria novifilia TaxID=2527975 RepID=A0A518BCU5_9BACT|nr:O-acetyl-ADP-ribose deacetylase [Planctomycetes bacterium Pan216]
MVTFGATKVTLLQGDITKQSVDAIVNAANSALAGGGGVDGAIHRAGGPSIMRECDRIRAERGGCATGSAVTTGAGELDAKHVIHGVGPIWGQASPEESDRLLAGVYATSLRLAHEHGCKSIAFPSISTGVYGFPIERAAPIALATVRQTLDDFLMDEVRFVLFSAGDLAVYESALSAFAGSSD